MKINYNKEIANALKAALEAAYREEEVFIEYGDTISGKYPYGDRGRTFKGELVLYSEQYIERVKMGEHDLVKEEMDDLMFVLKCEDKTRWLQEEYIVCIRSLTSDKVLYDKRVQYSAATSLTVILNLLAGTMLETDCLKTMLGAGEKEQKLNKRIKQLRVDITSFKVAITTLIHKGQKDKEHNRNIIMEDYNAFGVALQAAMAKMQAGGLTEQERFANLLMCYANGELDDIAIVPDED